jgi:hypothetical protein
MSADCAVISAEQLLEQVWDEYADPLTNAVAVTVMRRHEGDARRAGRGAAVSGLAVPSAVSCRPWSLRRGSR